MKADYVHKDTLTATDYVELNKNNELLMSYNQALLKANKELKEQIEELKSTNKVLSEELTKDKILKQDYLTTCCGIPIGYIPKLLNQQKEFIKYLEKEIKKYDSLVKQEFTFERYRCLKEILSKYKSIIGVSDE